MHDGEMLEEAEVMLPPTRVEVVDVEWRTGAVVSVVVAAVVVFVVVVAIVASCE